MQTRVSGDEDGTPASAKLSHRGSSFTLVNPHLLLFVIQPALYTIRCHAKIEASKGQFRVVVLLHAVEFSWTFRVYFTPHS